MPNSSPNNNVLGTSRALMWFRQDLRVNDNPALINAARHNEVLAVYIYDSTIPTTGQLGGASKWWLHHSLVALKASLHGNLTVLSGDPRIIIADICKQHNIGHVYWNRMYESWAISRDTEIKQTLKQHSIVGQSSNGSLLWEPMQVLKKDATPYKVFTPYYKNGCLQAKHPRYPEKAPKLTFLGEGREFNGTDDIDALNLLPTINWDAQMSTLWEISEQGAKDKLQCFINEGIEHYDDARNVPSVRGTSLLSPYLHFGLISPNQAWYAVHDAYNGSRENKGVYVYLSELGWREFSYYLLFHFKDIQNQNFNSKFDNFPWARDSKSLIAWQRGQTGIPIVDAGMRELWQTGYMHNRVRMIVASFLVKNLLIDWREGERWFWDCLLDADTASNSAGWQWVAGSGADAAPYFRIFNPILQGEKFDKQGQYVKKYCPELKNLGNKYIHKPWEAPSAELEKAGIRLVHDYPLPIVDLKDSRHRALDAYASIK